MVKMEPYIKEWYDYLREGKAMGLKCKRCGNIEFPPYPVCGECSGTDLEWTEINGDGELYAFSRIAILPFHPAPVISGVVKLDCGGTFVSWILDLGEEDVEPLIQQLPLRVKMEIIKVDEEKDLYYPVFRLKEPLKK